jgi:hypothetical protein
MKLTNWKAIAELVGIAAIVGSLSFVGLQLVQTKEIALNEAGFNRVGSLIEMYNARFEYADIWVRGNAGDELDRLEAMIYQSLVRTSWQRAFWDNQGGRRLGGTADVPIHDFAAFLFRNPGAREIWESDTDETNRLRGRLLSRQLREVEMQDIVRADLAMLDQMSN